MVHSFSFSCSCPGSSLSLKYLSGKFQTLLLTTLGWLTPFWLGWLFHQLVSCDIVHITVTVLAGFLVHVHFCLFPPEDSRLFKDRDHVLQMIVFSTRVLQPAQEWRCLLTELREGRSGSLASQAECPTPVLLLALSVFLTYNHLLELSVHIAPRI